MSTKRRKAIRRGVAAGTLWADVPNSWVCPVCGADKGMFSLKEGAAIPGPWAGQDVPAAALPAEDRQGAMDREQALLLSARCSNLAKGCAKQYLPEEAALFTQVADYFAAQAGPGEDLAALAARQKEDMASRYPEAFSAARRMVDRGALRALTWNEKVTAIQQTLVSRYETEGEQAFSGKNVYVCEACGFIYAGEEPPEICPVCKVPRFKFELMGKGA